MTQKPEFMLYGNLSADQYYNFAGLKKYIKNADGWFQYYKFDQLRNAYFSDWNWPVCYLQKTLPPRQYSKNTTNRYLMEPLEVLIKETENKSFQETLTICQNFLDTYNVIDMSRNSSVESRIDCLKAVFSIPYYKRQEWFLDQFFNDASVAFQRTDSNTLSNFFAQLNDKKEYNPPLIKYGLSGSFRSIEVQFQDNLLRDLLKGLVLSDFDRLLMIEIEKRQDASSNDILHSAGTQKFLSDFATVGAIVVGIYAGGAAVGASFASGSGAAAGASAVGTSASTEAIVASQAGVLGSGAATSGSALGAGSLLGGSSAVGAGSSAVGAGSLLGTGATSTGLLGSVGSALYAGAESIGGTALTTLGATAASEIGNIFNPKKDVDTAVTSADVQELLSSKSVLYIAGGIVAGLLFLM